jgi:hypothetical protein
MPTAEPMIFSTFSESFIIERCIQLEPSLNKQFRDLVLGSAMGEDYFGSMIISDLLSTLNRSVGVSDGCSLPVGLTEFWDGN